MKYLQCYLITSDYMDCEWTPAWSGVRRNSQGELLRAMFGAELLKIQQLRMTPRLRFSTESHPYLHCNVTKDRLNQCVATQHTIKQSCLPAASVTS